MLSPELKKTLRDFLPVDSHEIRDLPGGGKYAFISWQNVRSHLDSICNFEVEFSDPILIDDLCTIRCTISIEGVRRQGMGVCSVVKKGIRGTFVESAIADAFKNAAEQFGVAAYLDSPDVQAKLQSNSVLIAKYKAKQSRG